MLTAHCSSSCRSVVLQRLYDDVQRGSGVCLSLHLADNILRRDGVSQTDRQGTAQGFGRLVVRQCHAALERLLKAQDNLAVIRAESPAQTQERTDDGVALGYTIRDLAEIAQRTQDALPCIGGRGLRLSGG